MVSNKDKKRQGRQANFTGDIGQSDLINMFLRWKWFVRPIKEHDQGVDLQIEITDENLIGTGNHFGVQSKAKGENIKVTDRGISVNLKEGSADYILRQPYPVFLMFTSTHQDMVYWLDAKRAIREGQRKINRSITLTVSFREPFILTKDSEAIERERARFLDIFCQADSVASFSLSDIRQAIGNHQRELSSIDPRLQVRVGDLSHKKECTYEIHLKEGASLSLGISLNFNSPEDRQTMQEVFDYGVKRAIAVKRFSLSGSPLIQKLMTQNATGKLIVGGHSTETMDVFLTLPTEASLTSGSLRFRGTLTRGRRGMHIEAKSSNYPMILSVWITPEEYSIKVDFEKDATYWQGQSVGDMEGLAARADTFYTLTKADSINLTFKNEKINFSCILERTQQIGRAFRILAETMLMLEDLRKIVVYHKTDVVLDALHFLKHNEPQQWRIGRKILEGETVNHHLPELRFELPQNPEIRQLLEKSPDGYFRLADVPMNITAFGESVCTINLDVIIRGYEIKIITLPNDTEEVILLRKEGSKCQLIRSGASSGYEVASV